MNEIEILIEALGQVPELVEAAKTYKESNEKTITTMATAIKKRPEAVIPQKEVDKVTDAVKKLIIGLAISTLILTATLVAVLVHYTNSEMYLGKKYMELYQSDLLTKSEKEKLLKDAYMVSLYPEAYEGYPKAFRERLRKNKSIVDDRELEKIVKGKFSVKEKVGF